MLAVGAERDVILQLAKNRVARTANSAIGSQAGACLGEIRLQHIEIVVYHVDEVLFHVGERKQQMVVDTCVIGAFDLSGDGPVS